MVEFYFSHLRINVNQISFNKYWSTIVKMFFPFKVYKNFYSLYCYRIVQIFITFIVMQIHVKYLELYFVSVFKLSPCRCTALAFKQIDPNILFLYSLIRIFYQSLIPHQLCGIGRHEHKYTQDFMFPSIKSS